MPILQFPSTTQKPTVVSCTLCSLRIAPAKATVAMLDAHNQQTFACNAHFWDHGWFFLDTWITFAAQERLKLLARRRQEAISTYEWETGDAWTIR